ncbi:MobA/MobL family protein [Bradyrhizobium yuanmingense]|uniref:MobA/MobL family protein n=1 Tax=Bradyrhizobium yuanmingense TaxID=108015 RepID=UPI001CD5F4FB|nr:MobA/MobL family protein [Bradyrhizobium yuanmingense]MCA1526505.1 MobA/MobL family protein [Bradyrhizobium yuanmingense]
MRIVGAVSIGPAGIEDRTIHASALREQLETSDYARGRQLCQIETCCRVHNQLQYICLAALLQLRNLGFEKDALLRNRASTTSDASSSFIIRVRRFMGPPSSMKAGHHTPRQAQKEKFSGKLRTGRLRVSGKSELNIQNSSWALSMAIPFAHIAPVRLTENGGAVRNIAYTARTSVHDPRYAGPFDYSHLQGDLAHEEIILPDDCPLAYLDRSVFAVALDYAELRKIRTPLSERRRQPQVGLALILALPPSTEVSVAEAAEILRRIVLAARGSEAVPIHLAIHEAKINRHAHALFGLRPIDADGIFGLKLRDFVVRHRHTSIRKASADVVEGINWPDLAWECQQTYFQELGIDLVVDPIAPVPGKHFAPVVYSNGTIHSTVTKDRIVATREQAYRANVDAIERSPTHLIETLLRGRTSLRIAELERLCAKFYDSEADQTASVERILLDQNIVTLADAPRASKPAYATTRRIRSLLARAAHLIDQPQHNDIRAFTAADEDSVIAEISAACATRQMRESPLILGARLSDCSTATTALAAYSPIAGTVDMAVTGSSELRAVGRNRHVCLHPGRLVIVPRSELIDDQRLARLILATNNVGCELILGHVQSCQTGVVCRHLAACAADQVTKVQPIAKKDQETSDIVRLLRAGLVRHAIEEIANRGLFEFGRLPNYAEDASWFVVCDDPRRVEELSRTIRADRVRSGSVGKPVPLTGLGKKLELSIGEWIMTKAPPDSTLGQTEFARVLAIDGINSTIEVASDQNRRIDLKRGPAVRPAAALSIRDARELYAEAKLTLVATDPRRIWSALLLVATRGRHARLHVDPKIAQSKDELIKVARQSLPGALPHTREVRADPDAEAGKIIAAINDSFDELPATTPVVRRAPRPTNVAEGIRQLLANDRDSRLGYEQLFDCVGRHNPEHATNTDQVLSMYGDELTRTIIRFLAGIEPDRTGNTEPHIPFDLPPELDELEPERWNEGDIYHLKQSLQYMSLRAWRRSLRPTSNAWPAPSSDHDGASYIDGGNRP